MWVKFVVGSFLCSERFFSDFPLSSKSNSMRMQDPPKNHFRVNRASWVNISNCYSYYIGSLRSHDGNGDENVTSKYKFELF